jgi:hypothetical protein
MEPALLVFLCIIGAVAITMAGYAVGRTFGFGDAEEDPNRHDVQEEYRREVRRINLAQLQEYANVGKNNQRG